MNLRALTENRGFPWMAAAARVAAGGPLAFSGFMKLMSPPEELALTMEAYRILPFSLIPPFARLMPWGELFVGAYLVVGFFIRLSGTLAAGFYCMFLTALLSAVVRGISLNECGCFGQGGPHLSGWGAITLDAFLLLFALAALLDRRHYLSLDRLHLRQKGPLPE
ncbi:MAG TPA: MauE/DoxX family redox-associated membrane protein [Elusimicrobiota bacterium]|nr:MauE/DoxX family redox-associated membrane protein [Elusimicrobiota bacterium]